MNAVKLGSKPASLAGAQLIYEDRESGIYKLDFTAKRVSWRCIDGSFTGESGSAAYRACQADPATLLIAWSQPTGEAAVVVVNVPERQARVCHFYGEECSITPAKVVEWVAGDSP